LWHKVNGDFHGFPAGRAADLDVISRDPLERMRSRLSQEIPRFIPHTKPTPPDGTDTIGRRIQRFSD
jgi:hypothetical protein